MLYFKTMDESGTNNLPIQGPVSLKDLYNYSKTAPPCQSTQNLQGFMVINEEDSSKENCSSRNNLNQMWRKPDVPKCNRAPKTERQQLMGPYQKAIER